MTTVAQRITDVEKDVVSIKTRLTGIDGRLKGVDAEISDMRKHIDKKFDDQINRMIIWMVGLMTLFTGIQTLIK